MGRLSQGKGIEGGRRLHAGKERCRFRERCGSSWLNWGVKHGRKGQWTWGYLECQAGGGGLDSAAFGGS